MISVAIHRRNGLDRRSYLEAMMESRHLVPVKEPVRFRVPTWMRWITRPERHDCCVMTHRLLDQVACVDGQCDSSYVLRLVRGQPKHGVTDVDRVQYPHW